MACHLAEITGRFAIVLWFLFLATVGGVGRVQLACCVSLELKPSGSALIFSEKQKQPRHISGDEEILTA